VIKILQVFAQRAESWTSGKLNLFGKVASIMKTGPAALFQTTWLSLAKIVSLDTSLSVINHHATATTFRTPAT
jgi:hypothetical protein